MRIFQRIQQKLNWSIKQYIALIVALLLLTYFISALYQVYKPLPKGLNHHGQSFQTPVEFLSDQTFLDRDGKLHTEQQIFDAILTLIGQAQSTIVVDMFLFNAEVGTSTAKHRALSQELTDALIHKKALHPQMDISVITDPINTVYDGVDAEHLRLLRKAGIDVIVTDLRPLRASNPVWSGFWYMCCQNLGNNSQGGWLSNPFAEQKITLRSYLALFNFKANHRKTLVVDSLDGWKALITSANAHDGSSLHSNVAMIVHGASAIEVLDTERAVARMSQGDIPMLVIANKAGAANLPKVQILTEQAIYTEVLQSIAALQQGESLDLMMFYLSERRIVKALQAAQARGVKVRVLLDPNKDAFGREKNGMPNRQVAWELKKSGVQLRWCNTQGEQCHSKLLVLTKLDGTKQVILGSANYTARNLKNYNLETNVSVLGAADYPALAEAQQYFDTAWQSDTQLMSVDYQHYKDESWMRYWLYRFVEWSGLSTF